LTVKITEGRHKRGGANATAMSASNLKKKIRMLENRLDKALVRYNESLANNRNLRERIENSRRDRVVFDGIYKKLERQLHDKKKDLALVIERSNEAYEFRDKAQSEMQVLKSQADKKQQDFEEKFHHLGEVIEQERTARDLAAGVVPGDSMGTFGDSEHRGNLSIDQEQNIKKKVAKGAWNIAKDKAQMHLSSEKVQSYEEAFQQIQKATGIADIDELVTKFVEAEDKNFSLFNFVNELNSEIERLEMMISDTKAEIEKFKGQGLNTDNQRKKILHDLEARLQRTVAKADEYEEKYQTAMKTINQLKTGIQSIFTRIGCATTSVEEMLGNQGVTESNMMQYLGIIEQRTSQILQSHALNNQADGADAGMGLANLRQGGRDGASAPLGVQPPGMEDLSDEEDSEGEADERPLTREELKHKTLRGLSKKENAAKRKAKGSVVTGGYS